MATKPLTIEELIESAEHLSAREKARLAEHLIASLARDLNDTPPTPRRSLRGLWADLGPAPTDEEIEEARREMWGGIGEGDDY
jgi:hypothetical protein